MKRLLSLFLCITLFSPLLLISASAEQAITKTEAAELIVKMERFHKGLVYLIHDESEGIVIQQLKRTKVEDEDLYNRLVKASVHGDRYADHPWLDFYLLDGEYGKLSFWHEYMGEFLTEDYIQKNIEFNFAIIQLDDKVYSVDAIFYAVVPGFPILINEDQQKDILVETEDHIKIVDNDTVLLEAHYDRDSRNEDKSQSRGWLEVDFEYTEDGWRISGGEATDDFTRFCPLRENDANPETGDGVTVIIACLAVSMLGVGITVKKRRNII